MLKKLLLLTTAVLAASSSAAFAIAAPYVGAGLGIQNVRGYNGLIGNVFGGYGATVGQDQTYYLGGEVFANLASVPLSGKQSNRITYGLGASVIPGVMLNNNTMAYARVGVEASRYGKSNTTNTGGQLGLGLQTRLTQNWDVRGEYVYTGMGVINHFTTVQNNRFNVGFVYKLD